MDESHRERLERRLPHIYKNPQNWQREWESLLGQELGNHLDQIEESIRKFASLRPILLEFMSEYERDGTAERILAEYVEERLNGVPLHLLSKDFAPHSQLQHFEGAVTDEPGSEANDELDRIDRRSVTMAAESMSNPDAQQTMISMAPPPRPGAPMAPMTPVTPSTTFTSWRNSHIQAEAGPSRQAGVLSLPILSEVSETIENQKGKRTIDSLGPQGQQQSPTSPSKRPKTSSANIVPRVPLNITRTVDFFEVAENEYIFRDARCGPGWLVIRCYSGKTQFLEPTFRIFNHPLKNNLALGHFNQKMTCHPAPPKDKYTEEMILQNFAWRVYENVLSKTPSNPADEEVEVANNKLRQKAEVNNLPDIVSCEASNREKGKKKATKSRSRIGGPRAHRPETQETDDSYREELIREVVSFLLPGESEGDNVEDP